MTATELQKRVAAHRWYHTIDLGNGIITQGVDDTPVRLGRVQLPSSLRGKTVLDIGAWDGFFSFESERRGAARVVAADYFSWHGSGWGAKAGFQLAREALGSKVEDVDIDVMDIAPERLGTFDIVLFLGVLYHLRHPLLALDLLYEHVVGDLLVFQSMQRGSSEIEALEEDYPFGEVEVFDRPGFPRMHFIERRYSGDQTNWWVPNRACSEALLRSAGFDVVDRPEEEVFICRWRETPGGSHAVHPKIRGER
jgi:tRNA (mo5U34)-methyltransferase